MHFDRFVASAQLFDHVFTVDENCVPRYREKVASNVSVETLMFPVQPRSHFFDGFRFQHHRANFVGSDSHHVHARRRAWQDMMFAAASTAGLPLTVFDRNSDRKSANYRYPPLARMEVKPAVPHQMTADIYRDYLVSLNVNTIEDSQSIAWDISDERPWQGGRSAFSNVAPESFPDVMHTLDDGKPECATFP